MADPALAHAVTPLQSGVVDTLLANDRRILAGLLSVLRLVMFALALGLTVISFQAYHRQRSDRLERAFIGFAFVSMGAAVTMLSARVAGAGSFGLVLDIAETVPFIVGFGMLYRSLYG